MPKGLTPEAIERRIDKLLVIAEKHEKRLAVLEETRRQDLASMQELGNNAVGVLREISDKFLKSFSKATTGVIGDVEVLKARVLTLEAGQRELEDAGYVAGDIARRPKRDIEHG